MGCILCSYNSLVSLGAEDGRQDVVSLHFLKQPWQHRAATKLGNHNGNQTKAENSEEQCHDILLEITLIKAMV